jgi:hypothetical protein
MFHNFETRFIENKLFNQVQKIKMLIISQKTYGLILVSGIFFLLSACSQIRDFTKETTGPVSCADLVIEKAFNLHEEAKSGLALFFE